MMNSLLLTKIKDEAKFHLEIQLKLLLAYA